MFLDPNEEWEQTIYRNNANVVRQVQHNIENAKAARSFEAWNRKWVDVVAKHVSAWAHVEHGLGLHVYTPAQRDAPTNMINNALAVGAVHKLRFAQDIILYNLVLTDEIEGFDGTAHIETWQSDPIWQPTRELVEQLTATRDWAEAFFATSLVFEPLVGELFRSEFVMQVAALQGDFVTPTLIGSGESDVSREQRGARALFGMLTEDEEHGERQQEDHPGLAGRLDAALRRGGPQAPAAVVAGLREGGALRGRLRARLGSLRRPPGRARPRVPQGGVGMSDGASRPTTRRPTAPA